MDEEMKKRIAVFRFRVIADFVGDRALPGGELERLMQEKCTDSGRYPAASGQTSGSHHLEHICASLGIVLLHAEPYQPEGKVARWFGTVRRCFLTEYTPTTFENLNEKFGAWVSGYNDKRHSSTPILLSNVLPAI